MLIDGLLIIDDLMGVTTLSRFQVNSGSDPNTYSFAVDDFLATSVGQCVATRTDTGTACFAANDGCIRHLAAVPTPPDPPAELPHGMFSFNVSCIDPGATVTLNVTLPSDVPVGTKWWKYQNGSWYSLPIGSDDGDELITVTLIDKTATLPGLGDEDPTGGSIMDDGGPGYPGAVGWETYPTSKVRVMLPWIALLIAIIAGTSLLVLRHRHS